MKNIIPSLRIRDFWALICAIVLAQLSKLYSQDSESLDANIQLSFYSEYTAHIRRTRNDKNGTESVMEYDVARPVPLDLDGDGIVEALVVPYRNVSMAATAGALKEDGNAQEQEKEWSLKVLDLRPLHLRYSQEYHRDFYRHNASLPIYLESIFISEFKPSSSIPVKIATGQIIFPKEGNVVDKNDETDGENYVTNDFQGIPSIATLWSDGNVTLHVITAKKEARTNLGLMELWNVNPFQLSTLTSKSCIDFIEVDLLFERDAALVGRYGVLILAARYHTCDDTSGLEASSMYASFDLFTGEVLWVNDASYLHGKLTESVLKDPGGQKPFTRMNDGDTIDSANTMDERWTSTPLPDCHHFFNASFMADASVALSHAFSHPSRKRKGYIERDTQLETVYMHFVGDDENQKDPKRRKYHTESKTAKRKNWLSQIMLTRKRSHVRPKLEQPNAIRFHNRKGVDILSLRDGKLLCHESMTENVFHGDLNGDGVLEHVQFISSSISMVEDKNMIIPCTVSIMSDLLLENEGNITLHLCKNERIGTERRFDDLDLNAALPLPVESHYDGDGKMIYDIVYALSNGVLKRFDLNGNCKWTSRRSPSMLYDAFPGWDSYSAQSGFLSRIEFEGISSSNSPDTFVFPIFLAGDDKIAIFTAGEGRLLDQVSLPQASLWKPILSDLNGDSVTDVIIVTTDGIWGYCIEITALGSMFLRIMNLFLIIFLVAIFFFAILDDACNTFCRRSTDE